MVMRKESRKGVKERTGDERCECTGLHHRAFHKTISFIGDNIPSRNLSTIPIPVVGTLESRA
jgi:hypothetical protein